MKRILALTLLASVSYLFPAFSQTSPWTVGLAGGVFNYYGDASEYPSFNLAASRPAGALSIERKIGSFFRPQLQLMGGQIYGTKQYLDVEMTSIHTEAALKLGIDFMGMINKESKLEVAPNVGFVAAYFTPEVRRINGNESPLGSHINQGENFGTGLAWGGRLGYQFSDQWKGFAGLDMRYYLTNQVDAYEGTKSTTNDWLSFAFAGVGYSFKTGEKKPIDEDAVPDPDRLFRGQFTQNNLSKEGVELKIYDVKDRLAATAVTDGRGRFEAPGLKPDKEYTVKLEGEDRNYAEGSKLYIINEANEKVAVTNKLGDSRFAYTHMPQEEVNQLAPIEVDDSDTKMEGLFTYKKLAKSGVKLNLYDRNGDKVASTVTDIGGKFKFKGLSPEETYTVRLNEDDEGLFNQGRLYYLNNEGKRVAAAQKPKFNEYEFKQLTSEEANKMPLLIESDVEATMRGVYTYEDLPKAGVMMYLVDDEGNKFDSVRTGVDGSFQFSQLDPNKKYLVRINEEDVKDTRYVELFFLNEENEPVMRAGAERGGLFSFDALPPEEIAGLQTLERAEIGSDGKLLYRKESVDGEYVEGTKKDSVDLIAFDLVDETPDSKDPSLKKKNIYDVDFEKEIIYFDHDKYTVTQNQAGTKGSVIAKKLKANPAMRIEIHGYASQPGPAMYNVVLSQKRADELKRILVEKYGIDGGRITPVGKGEDPNSSEEDARRARIIIIE
ncbi:MAG: OmpA family protein [Salibacteraceae bacterium]